FQQPLFPSHEPSPVIGQRVSKAASFASPAVLYLRFSETQVELSPSLELYIVIQPPITGLTTMTKPFPLIFLTSLRFPLPVRVQLRLGQLPRCLVQPLSSFSLSLGLE